MCDLLFLKVAYSDFHCFMCSHSKFFQCCLQKGVMSPDFGGERRIKVRKGGGIIRQTAVYIPERTVWLCQKSLPELMLLSGPVL